VEARYQKPTRSGRRLRLTATPRAHRGRETPRRDTAPPRHGERSEDAPEPQLTPGDVARERGRALSSSISTGSSGRRTRALARALRAPLSRRAGAPSGGPGHRRSSLGASSAGMHERTVARAPSKSPHHVDAEAILLQRHDGRSKVESSGSAVKRRCVWWSCPSMSGLQRPFAPVETPVRCRGVQRVDRRGRRSTSDQGLPRVRRPRGSGTLVA
jgi:hypothetical protein